MPKNPLSSSAAGGDNGAPDAAAPASSAVSGMEGAVSACSKGRVWVPFDRELDLRLARFAMTDMGNAERWRVRYGADFRFCPEIGWFSWDGRRWALLSEERDSVPAEVMQSVFATVRAIGNEATLVAASGCRYPNISGEKAMATWLDWAEDKRADAVEAISERGESDLAAWVVEQERQDIAVNTEPSRRKLWSDQLFAHAKVSEGAGKLAAVAKLAKSFPDIAIRPAQLDQDRMAINVLNGTLRLARRKVKRSEEEVRAGKSTWKVDGWKIERTAHDRADLITKLAPVKYAPSATCPEWDAFLLKCQPDDAMRRFLLQWFGLSLTGDIGEQKLAFFYGSGRNGKGTAVEAVAHLAGDYAGSIPIESFLDNGGKRRGDQATPDIARLPGVRFLRVSEPEKGASLNEGLIKMVTGGDPVDARHLNKGFFTFLPDFKMTISGNHKPKVKDTSDGIWRRMQLVPWGVTIKAEDVDRSLPEKLRAEASGILNRLLGGLCDWRENGLIEPDEVRMATAAYRDQSDDLGRFLAACCEVGDDTPERPVRVKAKDLHDAFNAFGEQTGGAVWKPVGFKAAMMDKGFVQKHSNGTWWLGVRLRDGVDAESIRGGNAALHDEGSASCSAAVGQQGSDPFADELPEGF